MPIMCEECKCSNWSCNECGESNHNDCGCPCCGCKCQTKEDEKWCDDCGKNVPYTSEGCACQDSTALAVHIDNQPTERRKMLSLKRSNDRKVTNLVTPNGKQSALANTFGLPAGKLFSCPDATSICEKVCYAGRLEKAYKPVLATLMHNWGLLKDADIDTMVELLDDMLVDFINDCERRNAPKLFRIHWDGDFFNDTYTNAWKTVILNHPEIQFWVYTRVASAARMLKGIDNLSLYFSADSENVKTAVDLKLNDGIRMAYLAKTFAIGKEDIKEMIGRPAAKCPENNKQIPLISTNGSACVSCSLCVYSKSDIIFSSSKK